MKTTTASRVIAIAFVLGTLSGCAVNTFVTNVKVDTKTDARDVSVFKPSKEA